MHSSIKAVFTAPHPVLMMYTSSSRTDSAIRTFVSPTPFRVNSARATGTPSLRTHRSSQSTAKNGGTYRAFLVPSADDLCQLWVARPFGRDEEDDLGSIQAESELAAAVTHQ